MNAPAGGQRKIVYLASTAPYPAAAQALMRDYTDLFEADGTGRVWLDVTYNKADIPFAHRIAQQIQADLRRDLDVHAAAGVGPNKFVARLAAQVARRDQGPDGLAAVAPPDATAFVRPFPLDVLPGLGRVLRGKLDALGISTLGDLADRPRQALIDLAGKRGALLWERANGLDDDPIAPEREPERLTAQRRFATPLYDTDEIRLETRLLAEELGGRLRRHRLNGRTLSVEAQYPDHRTATRSLSLALPTDSKTEILRHALDLLGRTAAAQRGLRALGLAVSGFGEEEVQQLSFFDGA